VESLQGKECIVRPPVIGLGPLCNHDTSWAKFMQSSPFWSPKLIVVGLLPYGSQNST